MALCALTLNASAALRITSTHSNVVVSWTGPGRLQAASAIPGTWRELLGAESPIHTVPSQAQAYFRVLDRYALRGNLLEANSEMGVAEVDGKVYVIGGYPSSRVTVRTVQVYEPVSDAWERTTPLPLGVNHPMPAAANGKLYVIGGQTDAGSASFVDNVFEYDPATTNWTPRAPMPTARSAGVAAVIGDLIYVAGGRPPRGRDFAVYDTRSNEWTTLPDMPIARNHIAGGAIDGKVYVAGGRLGAGFTSPMTNVLEVFDPGTGRWSSRAPMLISRGGVNGIAVGGKLFVFGGEGPDGVFDDMDVYVASEDRWYPLQPLPTPVHGVTGAAYLDGWIHLPGGGTSTGGSSGSTLHQVFWIGGIVE